ncbi:MAG TPA: TfoX/Sxy family protein [Pirellulaceae bacterium]|nr:TfoX/Sxy family protein [Pirellulaceae bacterium]
MASNPFHQHVLAQLRGLGPTLRSRAMFGAHGLYLGDVFFAIAWRGQLYFKTTPATAARYIARGSEPFQPSPTIKLKNYYEVPESVIERPDELLAWALEAVDIGGGKK